MAEPVYWSALLTRLVKEISRIVWQNPCTGLPFFQEQCKKYLGQYGRTRVLVRPSYKAVQEILDSTAELLYWSPLHTRPVKEISRTVRQNRCTGPPFLQASEENILDVNEAGLYMKNCTAWADFEE